MTDVLGRDRYERQSASNGHRNGYKPGRIRSAEAMHTLTDPRQGLDERLRGHYGRFPVPGSRA